jgi:hypothetical protein
MAMFDCDDAVRAALAAKLSILTAQGRRHGTTTAGHQFGIWNGGRPGGRARSVVVRRSVLYLVFSKKAVWELGEIGALCVTNHRSHLTLTARYAD